ncbi:MAG TPA: ScyD/ScyE family protein, partial [Acidimicrobiales bacterium]
MTDSGNPIVGQGAFGAPGFVLEYLRTGPDRGSLDEVSEAEAALMDVAVAPDGTGWAIGGDAKLYHQDLSGVLSAVFDIASYQAGDPDPYDQDEPPGDATSSNPYGLAVLRSGDVLVVDAQNNDMLRIAPNGEAVTVARFLPKPTSTDHLPPDFFPFPLPPSINAEAVPTGVAIGRDGWVYVSQLTGFPFRPGNASIFRVNPWAEDAVCSTTPNPDCS